jgi:DNA polymerase III epsilon subunit-like protein
MKILVFDTETTGLPPKNTPVTLTDAWPYIVQLSYLVYDTEVCSILCLQDDIVKCPVSIPVESARIHGITDTIAQTKGSHLAELMPAFLKAVAEDAELIIAHNMSFDRDMVIVECHRLGIHCDSFLKKPMHCTMKKNINLCALARRTKTGTSYFKFPTLAELHYHLFRVRPDGMHNAKADVLICLRCYLKVNGLADIAVLQPELYEPYLDKPPLVKQVLKLQEGGILH